MFGFQVISSISRRFEPARAQSEKARTPISMQSIHVVGQVAESDDSADVTAVEFGGLSSRLVLRLFVVKVGFLVEINGF